MATKDTESLEGELADSENIGKVVADLNEQFKDCTLSDILNALLTEKGLSKSEVIKSSGLEKVYSYHIFAGRKKNPSRPKVLSIALAINLTTKETQHLLYYAGVSQLYVKNPWDSVIWYALENHLTVEETNHLLKKLSLTPLTEDPHYKE